MKRVNGFMFNFEEILLNIKAHNYRYIGSGSGRQVFDLGNGYVVKMAGNAKGIAQNKAEYQISSTSDNALFAKVLQVSPDFQLLIMEKAAGLQHISPVWRYFQVNSNKELLKARELREIARVHHLLLPDLRRHQNWGKINERPVIIDYGFTQKVKRKYYSIFQR